MAITTNTTYILIERPKGSTAVWIGTGGVSPQGYPFADTAEELAKKIATEGWLAHKSNTDYAWRKASQDAFWVNPAAVVEYHAEAAEGLGALQEILIGKRVETVTDLPGHQAIDVVVTPAY
jgi:hypothetical protein